MKSRIKNLVLAIAIGGALFGYTWKEYQDYKIPERINIEYLDYGKVMIQTYRSKSNELFEMFDELVLGSYKETYTGKDSLGFQNVRIDLLPIERMAKKIAKNWETYYVKNGK